MKFKNTKLKAMGLFAISTIGLNAHGLDLNNYIEIDTGSSSKPALYSDRYYSNQSGQTYKVISGQLELMYDLEDSVLTHINNEKVMGYMTNTSYTGGNYFLCNINDCNNIANRTFIDALDYFSHDYTPNKSSLNMYSGYGNNLSIGRLSDNDEYTIAVIDGNGQILDSFTTAGWSMALSGTNFTSMVSTTGITQEENFKLLSASYGDYEVLFKQWNSSSSQFEDLPFLLSDNQNINSVYSNGIAPIAISNPSLNTSGEIVYKVVLGEIDSINAISHLLWGEVTIVNGSARFTSTIKTAPYSMSIHAGYLISGDPIFNSDNSFTFKDQKLDFYKPQESALTNNENSKSGREMYGNIYRSLNSGSVIAREVGGNYILYVGSSLTLTSTILDIDPYIDPLFTITLGSNAVTNYYGIEANCTLQTSNAVVENQDYIALSETALQIPLEWDSVTGEWKGVQSLTGFESITGSHNFAQFDLTADVTTGTWNINCSGIASDIEGNSIPLASTDITINLDDQIHGGSGLVSGQITIPNTSDYSGVVVTITINGRQIEVTTEADGSFSFDRLVEGEYQVHLYNDQYVAACSTVNIDSSNGNTPLNIQMFAGDINNDGAVDIGDFSLLSGLMGLNSTDEDYDVLVDLNHDGKINVQDLSILGSHFGTDHCEVSAQ